jgi:hypothetical protein
VFEAIDLLLMDLYGVVLSEKDKAEIQKKGFLQAFRLHKELRRIKREEENVFQGS